MEVEDEVFPTGTSTGIFTSEEVYPKFESNPPLVKSVTEDEEEQSQGRGVGSDIEMFLHRYGEMMDFQEEEMAATMRHLRPLIGLLEEHLEGGNHIPSDHQQESGMDDVQRDYRYGDLRAAIYAHLGDDTTRFIQNDIQWTMALETVAISDRPVDDRISVAELVMTYRSCVLGMQTLKTVPLPSSTRDKIRQRSLRILSQSQASTTNGKVSPRMPLLNIDPINPRAIESPTCSQNRKNGYIADEVSSSRLMMVLVTLLLAAIIPWVNSTVWHIKSPIPQLSPSSRSTETNPHTFLIDTAAAEDTYHAAMPQPQSNSIKAKMFVKFPKVHRTFSNTIMQADRMKNATQALFSGDESGPLSTGDVTSAVTGGAIAMGLSRAVATTFARLSQASLSPQLSVGITVVAATLTAHGIKGLLESFFRRLRRAWKRD